MNTSSLAFPNLFDVARNKVAVLSDNQSIINRCRLLMLTEPTEVYNEPEFGVGLKKYLWQYNTDNTKALVRDRITDQIRRYEPCVKTDGISFSDGLLFTENTADGLSAQEFNQLKMTVGLKTKFGDELEVTVDDNT